MEYYVSLSSPASHMLRSESTKGPSTSAGASFDFFAQMTSNTSSALSRS